MRAVRRGGDVERNALRIAIARAGRIEREWVIEGGSVTFGRADDADVVLADHASERTTLVRIDDGEMTLVLPVGATGRVQLAGEAREVAALAGSAVTLDTNARGRIVLTGSGESAVSVLFQRVPAPVKRTRAELPASVRGGLLDRVDWLFTALAAASFMAHLAFVVGMSNADWPMPPSLAAATLRDAQTIFIEPPMPPTPTMDDPSDPADPSDTDPAPTDPSPSHDTAPSHPHDHATSSPHLQADPQFAAQQALHAVDLLLIGSASSIHGTVDDLLRNAQPTIGAAEIFAQADDGTQVATADHVDVRGGQAPGATDFGPRRIGTHPGEMDHAAPLHEDGPRRTSITLAPILDPVDPALFSDEELRRVLRARMPMIRRCYETELTRTPGLQGRISVSMQVETIGNLSHVEAVDDTVNARGLTECVLGTVRSIRLRVGPTEPVTVEYPMVFAPQD